MKFILAAVVAAALAVFAWSHDRGHPFRGKRCCKPCHSNLQDSGSASTSTWPPAPRYMIARKLPATTFAGSGERLLYEVPIDMDAFVLTDLEGFFAENGGAYVVGPERDEYTPWGMLFADGPVDAVGFVLRPGEQLVQRASDNGGGAATVNSGSFAGYLVPTAQ